MKKFSDTLNPLADQFYEILNDFNPIEIKDYGWENYVWHSNLFSWAHLEKYCTDKVSVLHCVIMPKKNSRAPIYGFDVIEISGKLTGLFLDLTPVDNRIFDVPQVGNLRPVPEWANFFSPNFLCTAPSEKDVYIGLDLLVSYFRNLPDTTELDYSYQQQQYINGQRKNPQTFKMLRSQIGEEKAREFMNNILFPDII